MKPARLTPQRYREFQEEARDFPTNEPLASTLKMRCVLEINHQEPHRYELTYLDVWKCGVVEEQQ